MTKSRIKFGALLAVMLIVSMALVSVVSAKEDKISDPVAVKVLVEKLNKAGDNADKVFAKLSPQEKADVIEYLNVTEVGTKITKVDGPKGDISSSATISRSFQIEKYYKNSVGMTIFSYFQKIDWSYDGSKITSKTRLRWGEVYLPLWSYNGHVDNVETGGVGLSSYRAWTQGEFKSCLGGNIGCVSEKFPWIDMTVYADGRTSYSVGG